jgi:hypothetical protein
MYSDAPQAHLEHSERSERLRNLAFSAEQRFQDASEEDQMLSLLAQRISFIFGGMDGVRDDIARRLIVQSHGPKFADRVLGDPELRRKLGLDRPVPEGNPVTIARTIPVDR